MSEVMGMQQSVESMERSLLRDYLELCKPRVVLLMLLTSAVGMCLAAPANHVPWRMLFIGNLGIAFVAAAAAALNHIADRQIDRLMRRTHQRPIATGRLSTHQSFIFSVILCVIGLWVLIYFVNVLTAMLTLFSLVGYAVFYTLYLKHVTPQNIVIGGIAGAAPPLLGWTAVTGALSPEALLPVLIIFVWTPPHFWALAIHRFHDYANASVPMLPNTHGIPFTRLNVLLYTILLTAVSLMPFMYGMSSWVYLLGIVPANGLFLYYAWRLYRSDEPRQALRVFHFSITWLSIVFVLLLIDHYVF